VTRCAREGNFDPASSAVGESIDELRSVLDTTAYEVVCCRHVSHLTTPMLRRWSETTRGFDNGGITFSNTPDPAAWPRRPQGLAPHTSHATRPACHLGRLPAPRFPDPRQTGLFGYSLINRPIPTDPHHRRAEIPSFKPDLAFMFELVSPVAWCSIRLVPCSRAVMGAGSASEHRMAAVLSARG
jgi:hypothetical protein